MLLLSHKPLISLVKKASSNEALLWTKLVEMASDATPSLVESLKEERKRQDEPEEHIYKPNPDSPGEGVFRLGVMQADLTHTQVPEAVTAESSPGLVSEELAAMNSPLGNNLMKRKKQLDKKGRNDGSTFHLGGTLPSQSQA